MSLSPGGTRRCLEMFLVLMTGGRGWYHASGEESRDGFNILQPQGAPQSDCFLGLLLNKRKSALKNNEALIAL